MEILVKRFTENAKMPIYGHDAGSGVDLCSSEEVTIEAGDRAIISTGVAMALPVGYVGLIGSQYSAIVDESVKVMTGMIDSGYRSEIKVEVKNIGKEARSFKVGDKVAFFMIQQVYRPSFIEVEELGRES